MCGLERVTLTKREEAELKKLRFSLRVTRMDKIRNEDVRGTARDELFGNEVREASLKWIGHVQRSDGGYIGEWKEEGKEEAAGGFHGCSEGIHAQSWFNV